LFEANALANLKGLLQKAFGGNKRAEQKAEQLAVQIGKSQDREAAQTFAQKLKSMIPGGAVKVAAIAALILTLQGIAGPMAAYADNLGNNGSGTSAEQSFEDPDILENLRKANQKVLADQRDRILKQKGLLPEGDPNQQPQDSGSNQKDLGSNGKLDDYDWEQHSKGILTPDMKKYAGDDKRITQEDIKIATLDNGLTQDMKWYLHNIAKEVFGTGYTKEGKLRAGGTQGILHYFNWLWRQKTQVEHKSADEAWREMANKDLMKKEAFGERVKHFNKFVSMNPESSIEFGR